MKGELRAVSFRCQGHPDIRATHHKSVEFTTEADITGRATCILGVAADMPPGALAGFRGPVRLTIEAGGHSNDLHAVANPGFDPAERMVVRTSRHNSPDTFALAADKGADQLDRRLASRLTDPHTIVTVTVIEEPAPARPATGESPLVRDSEGGESLSLQLAVLRACRPDYRGPVLVGLPGDGAAAFESALRARRESVPATVWEVGAGQLAEALSLAADSLGQGSLAVAVEPESPSALWLRGSAADVRAQWRALGEPPGSSVFVVLEDRAPDTNSIGRDELLAALLAEGVPSRTIATALGSLPGGDYRAAYRYVLELKSGTEGTGDR